MMLVKIASLVSQFFQEEGFTVQSANTSMGHIIQAKKGGFFRGMKKLVITDISNEDFASKIHSIHNVDLLVVPKNVSKATVITKCSFVEKIEQE